MQLTNIYWPQMVREQIIKTITDMGGKLTIKGHIDKLNTTYFYMFTIMDIAEEKVQQIIQDAFTKWYTNSANTRVGYTYSWDNIDYVVTTKHNCEQCLAVRNVNVTTDVTSKIKAQLPNLLIRQYQSCVDYYILPHDIDTFFKVFVKEVNAKKHSTASNEEVVCYIKTQRYVITENFTYKKRKCTDKIVIDTSLLPKQLVLLICEKIRMHAGVVPTKDSCNKLTMKSNVVDILKALRTAYQTYINNVRDCSDYPFMINNITYCFDYCNSSCLPTKAVCGLYDPENLFFKLSMWMSKADIFSIYTNKVWYVDEKHWGDVEEQLNKLKHEYNLPELNYVLR